MLIYRVSNDCEIDRLNQSVHAWDKQYAVQEYVLMIAIVPVSLIACVMNGVAFYIFQWQKFDKPNAKFNLLCVALSEINLQLAVGLEALVVLTGFEHFHSPVAQCLSSLVHIYINVALCIRNWNVVLLAVARCEAILLPIASHHPLRMSPRVLKVAEGFIFLLAGSLAIVRNLQVRGILCTNLGSFLSVEGFLSNYEVFQMFDIYAMFFFQSFLPVSIILVCTVIMWVALRRQYAATSTLFVLFKGLRCRHASFTNRKRTSYLAFFMSFGFCLFEIPTFVNTCIGYWWQNVTFLIHPDLIGNALVIVNSLVNFIVYSASSALFRKAFLRFWLDGRYWCSAVRRMGQEDDLMMAGSGSANHNVRRSTTGQESRLKTPSLVGGCTITVRGSHNQLVALNTPIGGGEEEEQQLHLHLAGCSTSMLHVSSTSLASSTTNCARKSSPATGHHSGDPLESMADLTGLLLMANVNDIKRKSSTKIIKNETND